MSARADRPLRRPWSHGLARASARFRADLAYVIVDALAVVGAYVVMLVIRLEGDISPARWRGFLDVIPAVVAIHLAVNWSLGLYDHLWRHASVLEARRVVVGGATSIAAVTAIIIWSRPMPLSVALLGGLVATFSVGVTRFQSRLFALRRDERHQPTTRVVVLGAGTSGGALLREMREHREAGYMAVAVLDDDVRTHGRALHGVKVLGTIDDLPAVTAELGAQQAILAIRSADHEVVRRASSAADLAGVPLRVLPTFDQRVEVREASLQDIRDVSIDDLLGRHPIRTDLTSTASLLRGKRILITGGGGFIGSELARQVHAFEPERLVLVDHDETHLFDVAGDLTGPVEVALVLADIRDPGLMVETFLHHRPHVVLHAAAHKHVPMLEHHPSEGVMTNVLGTLNVVRAARRAGVERLVLISTDKAVEPSSVMGATKRVAERIVLNERSTATRYSAVRFGNVLGSRGSVVPTFTRQLRQGKRLTVTDPRMTRFFISVEEACHLVLQAANLAEGGEVFMLDMGEPVAIMDLARKMLQLAGRGGEGDEGIELVGMRPGEKLEEALAEPAEVAMPTVHPSIVRLVPAYMAAEDLRAGVELVIRRAQLREHDAVREAVFTVAAGEPVEPLAWTGHRRHPAPAVIDLRDGAHARRPATFGPVSPRGAGSEPRNRARAPEST